MGLKVMQATGICPAKNVHTSIKHKVCCRIGPGRPTDIYIKITQPHQNMQKNIIE